MKSRAAIPNPKSSLINDNYFLNFEYLIHMYIIKETISYNTKTYTEYKYYEANSLTFLY